MAVFTKLNTHLRKPQLFVERVGLQIYRTLELDEPLVALTSIMYQRIHQLPPNTLPPVIGLHGNMV